MADVVIVQIRKKEHISNVKKLKFLCIWL